MLTILARNWWILALRGALSILFGILVLVYPGLALSTLILLFGLYSLIDGISTAMMAVQQRKHQYWWVHLLEGLVGILAGILAVAYPGVTALILLYIIAAWAVFTGMFEIWGAIRLRKEIKGELWLGLSGVISVLFGLLLVLTNPLAGIMAVLTLVAAYAVFFGIIMLVLAFRIRGMGGSTSAGQPTRSPA